MKRKRSQLENKGSLGRRALRQRHGLQAYAFIALCLALISTLFPWLILRYGALVEQSSDGAELLQGQIFLAAGLVAVVAVGLEFLRDGSSDRLLLALCLVPLGFLAWFVVAWSGGASFEPLLRSAAFEKVVERGLQRRPEDLVAVLGLGFWGSVTGAVNASAAALLLVTVPWSTSEDA